MAEGAPAFRFGWASRSPRHARASDSPWAERKVSSRLQHVRTTRQRVDRVVVRGTAGVTGLLGGLWPRPPAAAAALDAATPCSPPRLHALHCLTQQRVFEYSASVVLAHQPARPIHARVRSGVAPADAVVGKAHWHWQPCSCLPSFLSARLSLTPPSALPLA